MPACPLREEAVKELPGLIEEGAPDWPLRAVRDIKGHLLPCHVVHRVWALDFPHGAGRRLLPVASRRVRSSASLSLRIPFSHADLAPSVRQVCTDSGGLDPALFLLCTSLLERLLSCLYKYFQIGSSSVHSSLSSTAPTLPAERYLLNVSLECLAIALYKCLHLSSLSSQLFLTSWISITVLT